MKERPILFNTAMVQAILSGRKTQTRRVMLSSHAESVAYMGGSDDEGKEFKFAGLFYGTPIDDDGKELPDQWMTYCTEYPEEGSIPIGQGPGAIGDRLWVRETFQGPLIDQGGDYPDGYEKPEFCVYAADGTARPVFTNADEEEVCRWRPSIHMPRWACRIILEITGLRIEQLNTISNKDCKAEGYPESRENDGGTMDPFLWFRNIWNSTGGNWAENPWVWVIEFKVLTLNGVVPEVAA